MSSPPSETLLIVGASARAAAQSALRAGWRVAAVDLFGDLDLQAIATTIRVADYPGGLVAAASEAPPGPWLYTGGLENHPDVVAAITEHQELLGNGPDVLKSCRNPIDFRNTCFIGALPYVSWCALPDEVPDQGKWMLKPIASAGGQGMQLFRQPPYPIAPATHFWEEFKEGVSQSGVYIAGERGWRLLGVTEQLSGATWTGATGFQYAGSIGPIAIERAVLDEYEQIGLVLTQEYGLRGFFGVDTILSPEGELFPIELNPRYTASIEVLERSLGIHTMAMHVEACRRGTLPDFDYEGVSCEESHGKAIVYAREALTVSQAFVDWCLARNTGHTWPSVADIPHVGTQIDAGQPIVTVFAEGSCTESVRQALQKRCDEVFRRSHLAPRDGDTR